MSFISGLSLLADAAQKDEADVEDGGAENAEDNGCVIGAPSRGDDGGLGVVGGIEDGDGVACGEVYVAGAIGGEDLYDFSGGSAEAEAWKIDHTSLLGESGDVFGDGSDGTLLGTGEEPGVGREGRGDGEKGYADTREPDARAGGESCIESLEQAKKAHGFNVREGARASPGLALAGMDEDFVPGLLRESGATV
jgi:hypothetical protein